MSKGIFGVKIDFEGETIIKQRYDKIEEIKKTVDQLEAKFR